MGAATGRSHLRTSCAVLFYMYAGGHVVAVTGVQDSACLEEFPGGGVGKPLGLSHCLIGDLPLVGVKPPKQGRIGLHGALGTQLS